MVTVAHEHSQPKRRHRCVARLWLADTAAVSVISYLLALPLALLIEYPAVQLYKAAVESGSGKETEKDTSVKNKRL
ncbi:hypothetical protein EVAR_86704_1 [Eumeta japonica]|uniref:Uncharacterized protein n=1 Tax=Eumeta variegata TaxID=151549 RepID=A0A4C1Y026_EUMVA|nr:hypothetical protein EVAR_86704_1 [Eumeta japonica]